MEEMTFTKAIGTCFKNYFTFSGRARRKEYWYFILFSLLISLLLSIFKSKTLTVIISIVMFFPTWTVTVRRLHDTNKSGFFCFLPLLGVLPLIPATSNILSGNFLDSFGLIIFGGIVYLVVEIILFIFLVSDSDLGMNNYGDSPKYPRKQTYSTSQNSVQDSFSQTTASQSAEKTWKCEKCGCSTNLDASNWCKECNAPRYSMETISEDKKYIIKEYIEKQLATENLTDALKLQDSYFSTSSLNYMVLIIPDVKKFNTLEEYKEKLTEIKQ